MWDADRNPKINGKNPSCHLPLKGQCHEICDPFVYKKNSTCTPDEQAKAVS